ncbi:MAG: hypothetical protein ACI8TP_002601 [Acidimicrobiales bacterium]
MPRGDVVARVKSAHRDLATQLNRSTADGSLDDSSLRAPSQLPGWSRAHVLAHLIGNADSITAGLVGAAAGRVDASYPGGLAQREDDIQRRSVWPRHHLLIELDTANSRLEAALEALDETSWQGYCRARGSEWPVAELPSKRIREVEIHRVDLGLASFTTVEWSADFLESELRSFQAGGAELPAPIAARSLHQQVAWILGRPAAGLAASWTASTLDPTWCRSITQSEIAELDTALRHFRSLSPSLDLAVMTTDDFPLHEFRDVLVRLRRQLISGAGVAALEGFPVDSYTEGELRAIWWGLSLHLGSPRAQSKQGDVIGDVRDIGTGISGKAGRGYTSNSELNFHADVTDVSGLFFLRTAKEGGVTRLASAVMTHDRIAASRPDLLDVLYRPLPCSWQGNQPPGDPGWYDIPVFGHVAGEVSCSYVRTNITLAAKNAGSRPLTAEEIEAVELVKATATAPDLWVERQFDAGSMLFVHNHSTLHLRTEFTDWDEPERKRHLLRIWLSVPNNRRLPASFATFFGDVTAGSVRGGYQSQAAGPVFTTLPAT